MLVAANILTGAFASVLTLVVVKLLHLVYLRRKWVAKFKDIPQRPSIPVFGNLLDYPGPNDKGLAFQRENTEQNPRCQLVWLGHIASVVVHHPDTVKVILKSSEPKAKLSYNFLDYWLGEGLLTSNGSKWARNRRLLTPAFHFDILKRYLQLKNSLCEDLLKKFKDASSSGKSLKVFDNISMFTLDVILQSAMSYKTGCQSQGEVHPYIEAGNRIMFKIVRRFLQPWFYSDGVYFMTPTGLRFKRDCDFVHQVADQVITNRKKELKNQSVSSEDEFKTGERKCRDFLDTLITARDADGNGLTDKEIRDEVDTFLFEGHDTTSSAISWSLFSIAEHQNVQQRIQEELDAVFQSRDNDHLLWEDLGRLPYLTMMIKESMRLHTPVHFVMRQLTKDTVIDGYTVPKDTLININIYNIHHNPTVWEDVMKFDPERFTPENSEKRDPFAFIPFSAGSRNCIGQNFAMDEIKVALARILHRYTIRLDPNHKVTKVLGLVMKAENDIKLLIKPRHPA